MRRWCRRRSTTSGRLDIVVNNAGYTWDGMAHKMSDEQFRAMLEIHTVVPFRVLRAAAPHLRDPAKLEQAEGREVFRKVVNVTSISGTQGNIGQANYSTAKAGLVGLTKTLAREWGPLKVNVNAVAFGFVETRLTATLEEAGTFEQGDVDDPARNPRANAGARANDHPAGSGRDAAGRGRTDLLPLLAVVELRPRPGDHRQRRPDDGDDVVTELLANPFALDAIGRTGEEHRFEVTAGGDPSVCRGHRRRCAGRSRRARRAAGLRDPPRLGDDRPRIALRRLGRGSASGRALRAGHDPAPADRGWDEARLTGDAGGAPRAAERNQLVIRTETETVEGELVNVQFVTEFFRGVHADASHGEQPPGHRLDETGQGNRNS